MVPSTTIQSDITPPPHCTAHFLRAKHRDGPWSPPSFSQTRRRGLVSQKLRGRTAPSHPFSDPLLSLLEFLSSERTSCLLFVILHFLLLLLLMFPIFLLVPPPSCSLSFQCTLSPSSTHLGSQIPKSLLENRLHLRRCLLAGTPSIAAASRLPMLQWPCSADLCSA